MCTLCRSGWQHRDGFCRRCLGVWERTERSTLVVKVYLAGWREYVVRGKPTVLEVETIGVSPFSRSSRHP